MTLLCCARAHVHTVYVSILIVYGHMHVCLRMRTCSQGRAQINPITATLQQLATDVEVSLHVGVSIDFLCSLLLKMERVCTFLGLLSLLTAASASVMELSNDNFDSVSYKFSLSQALSNKHCDSLIL